jgi:ATP-dependent Clp protease adaptor protein ClpS
VYGFAAGHASNAGRRATATDLWAYLRGSEAAKLVGLTTVSRVLFRLCHGSVEDSAVRIEGHHDVHVVLRNDDYTPQQFVCSMLEGVFGLGVEEANVRMMLTHTEGRAIIGRYRPEEARAKIDEARGRARAGGFRCGSASSRSEIRPVEIVFDGREVHGLDLIVRGRRRSPPPVARVELAGRDGRRLRISEDVPVQRGGDQLRQRLRVAVALHLDLDHQRRRIRTNDFDSGLSLTNAAVHASQLEVLDDEEAEDRGEHDAECEQDREAGAAWFDLYSERRHFLVARSLMLTSVRSV